MKFSTPAGTRKADSQGRFRGGHTSFVVGIKHYFVGIYLIEFSV